jgi:hypothetical protein
MPTRPRRETAETANGNGGSEALAKVREQTLEQLSGTPVTIDNETVYVGKLCINQLVALSHFGVKLWKVVGSSGLEPVLTEMMKVQPEAPADEDAGAKAERKAHDKAAMDAALTQVSGMAVLDSILDVLTAEQIGGLFGIVLDRDTGWCCTHIGLPDMMRIGEAIVEHNEVATLVAYFSRATKRLGLSTTPSSKP